MGESRELTQRLDGRCPGNAECICHRDCRERIRRVVQAGDLQLRHERERLVLVHECDVIAAFNGVVLGVGILDETEPEDLALTTHDAHERIIEVHDGRIATIENASLRFRICLDRVIAIHVIGRDIENGCGRRAQRMRRIELEAR